MENDLRSRGRILLLIAGAVAGVLLNVAVELLDGDVWPTTMFVAIIAICLAVFLIINRQTVWQNRRRPIPWIILGAAVTVAIALLFAAADEFRFGFLMTGFLAVPAMLLLYASAVLYDVPAHEDGRYLVGAGKLLVVSSILSVPDFFKTLGALFRRRTVLQEGTANGTEGQPPARKRISPALIGFIIGIPLLIAVMALLISADENMGALLRGFGDVFRGIDVVRWGWRVWLVFRMMLFVFPLMFGTRFHRGDAPRVRAPHLPGPTLAVICGLMLAAYALFLGLQFSYLFGGVLPEAYTYSSYAVKGFAELIVVSGINDVLLALMESYSEKKPVVTVLQWALLIANALLLASAGLRLGMYIGAYGWTEKRFLSAWLMVFVAFLTLLTGARFLNKHIPLRRVACVALIVWYAALFAADWSTVFGFGC